MLCINKESSFFTEDNLVVTEMGLQVTGSASVKVVSSVKVLSCRRTGVHSYWSVKGLLSCAAFSHHLLKVSPFGKWHENCVPEILLKCELYEQREINLV